MNLFKKIFSNIFPIVMVVFIFSLFSYNIFQVSAAPVGTSGAGTSVGTSGDSNTATKLENPLAKTVGANDENMIFRLISIIVDIILTLASIAAVLYIIWIGFQYVMARGNSSELAKLHAHMLNVVIGIAVIFSAKVIAKVIENTLSSVTK